MNAGKTIAVAAALLVVVCVSCATNVSTFAEPLVDENPAAIEPAAPDTSAHTCETYGAPTRIGTVADPGLLEISGLVVGRANPDVLWVHNDSGDGPFVYAISREGAPLARVQLAGVHAIDWEDLAIGPCGDEACLIAGDIGDNRARRNFVVLYQFKEPAIFGESQTGDDVVEEFRRIKLTYPDGPRNAEGLAVAPDGTIYVFSKEPGRSRVYRVPGVSEKGSGEMEFVVEIPIVGGVMAYPTAADISTDGTRLLIRTYLSAYEWRAESSELLWEAAGLPGNRVPAANEEQGEAIAYDPALGGYSHISEGANPAIYRVPCAD